MSVDNGHSLGGMYGIANNEIAAWLLNRGQGELLALSPAELSKGMTAPKCPSPTRRATDFTKGEHHAVDEPCPWTMRYRPTGWACYEHDAPVRLPLGMLLQDAPKLIDFGDGPEKYVGTIEQLLEMAGKTVDVVYQSDAPGLKATWRYVVS